jgi:hypothetical protein
VLVTVEHERSGRAVERGYSGIARPARRSVLTLSAVPAGRPLDRGSVISLGPAARLRVRTSGRRSGAPR